MTKIEAARAMEAHSKIEGGAPNSEDYDTGYIVDVEGDTATVAWDSGVRTTAPIADLRLA